MSNVRKLSAGPCAEHHLINTVRDLLKRVKRGEITAIAVVASAHGIGKFFTAAVSNEPGGLPVVHLLGALRFLEEDLIRHAHDEPTGLVDLPVSKD